MYPLGLLFGLGFDTASEVALLAMTAGAAAGNLPDRGRPVPAAPVRGRHVGHGHDRRRADGQGLQLGVRSIRCARSSTTSSRPACRSRRARHRGRRAVAGLIDLLGLSGPFFDFVADIDFGVLGYLIVGLFLLAWGLSVAHGSSAASKSGIRAGRDARAPASPPGRHRALAQACALKGRHRRASLRSRRADRGCRCRTPTRSRACSAISRSTSSQACASPTAQSTVRYTVVLGQLPALRELHAADADRDGVTSEAERDAYAQRLAQDIVCRQSAS